MIAEILLGGGLCMAIAVLAKQQKDKRRSAVLLEIGLSLNSTLKRKELLEIMMSETERALRAEAASIILVDDKTGELYFEIATGEKKEEVKQIRLQPGEGIAGWVAASGQSVLIADASQDTRWSNRVANRVNVPTRNLLCVPVVSNQKTLGVLQVINKQGNRPFNQTDLHLLEMIASPAAVALENMLLYEALLESMENLRLTTAAKERMESEMKIAQDIQRSFLPGDHLSFGGVELHASLVSAREVGGDFYHFMPVDEKHLLICLGDVSDKGMPAALFMSGLMIWIKAKAQANLSPANILESINRELCSEDSTMFATIFLAIIDTTSGKLTYSSGGHCPPYLLSSGEVSELKEESSLPIGVFPETSYRNGVRQLYSGDVLILYTDGITEAENIMGDWYGSERLSQLLQSAHDTCPEAVIRLVRHEVESFAAGREQSDDIAILVAKMADYPTKIAESSQKRL